MHLKDSIAGQGKRGDVEGREKKEKKEKRRRREE